MPLTRREMLGLTGRGLGTMALGSALPFGLSGCREEEKALGPLAVRAPHYNPRAKRVVLIHMLGGVSQLDLFDFKPELNRFDGKVCPDELCGEARFAQISGPLNLLGTPYQFEKHGDSGTEISELLPNIAGIVDDITVIKSMHTEPINHGPAQLFFHTGFERYGRPSFGSWVIRSLGSENENLPGYVVLRSDDQIGAGNALWNSGFLPSMYRGVEFRSGPDSVFFLTDPPGIERPDRRRILDAVRALNEERLGAIGDPEIAARIAQYELAFRMQRSIPELTDLRDETESTLEMYGAVQGVPSFANNCLLARRLLERGVRFVELFDGDWDHHSNVFGNLPEKCRQVDRASAALVTDLKERGLLEDTLVIWCTEFGRTPVVQKTLKKVEAGRDHHADAFTVWLAGGGIKAGLSYGQSDELGYRVAENPVHVHDLQATVLHLLGLDHEKLTYRFQGRDFRLTDVAGEVVSDILA